MRSKESFGGGRKWCVPRDQYGRSPTICASVPADDAQTVRIHTLDFHLRRTSFKLRLQDASSNGRPVRHRLIRRDAMIGFAARKIGKHFPNLGHSRGAAHQQNSIQITPVHSSSAKSFLASQRSSIQQVLSHRLKLLSCDLRPNPIPLMIAGNCSLTSCGKSSLGLFALTPDSSRRIRIVA